MAHNLIVSYAPHRHIEIIRPFPAVPKEIRKFHSNDLVEFLSLVSPELLADPELGMQFERLQVGDVYCFLWVILSSVKLLLVAQLMLLILL
jgi:histone deacetylase 1/2